MLKMCEKVTKIFRNRSTATVRTDFVSFSHIFSILDIRSRFQSPFLGLTTHNTWPTIMHRILMLGCYRHNIEALLMAIPGD